MPAKTVNVPLPEAGETLYDSDEKVFEDIKAKPGEKAFIFIHTVPYEGSVALVNLLTATRLVRKGFNVTVVLYVGRVVKANYAFKKGKMTADDVTRIVGDLAKIVPAK